MYLNRIYEYISNTIILIKITLLPFLSQVIEPDLLLNVPSPHLVQPSFHHTLWRRTPVVLSPPHEQGIWSSHKDFSWTSSISRLVTLLYHMGIETGDVQQKEDKKEFEHFLIKMNEEE